MTEPEPAFALSESERRNPVWLKLSAYFTDMLKDKRGKNDGPLDQFQTATLRGEIQLLKRIINLGQEPPPQDGF